MCSVVIITHLSESTHDINVTNQVETVSTEYQFDRIMVLPNNLVNRIVYLFPTSERIAILDLIQTCILQYYEYTYSIQILCIFYL